jgi:hypothetical protein
VPAKVSKPLKAGPLWTPPAPAPPSFPRDCSANSRKTPGFREPAEMRDRPDELHRLPTVGAQGRSGGVGRHAGRDGVGQRGQLISIKVEGFFERSTSETTQVHVSPGPWLCENARLATNRDLVTAHSCLAWVAYVAAKVLALTWPTSIGSLFGAVQGAMILGGDQDEYASARAEDHNSSEPRTCCRPRQGEDRRREPELRRCHCPDT